MVARDIGVSGIKELRYPFSLKIRGIERVILREDGDLLAFWQISCGEFTLFEAMKHSSWMLAPTLVSLLCLLLENRRVPGFFPLSHFRKAMSAFA